MSLSLPASALWSIPKNFNGDAFHAKASKTTKAIPRHNRELLKMLSEKFPKIKGKIPTPPKGRMLNVNEVVDLFVNKYGPMVGK